MAETKLNNFVYTLPADCTVQLINTWRHAGLSRGFVDYSENEEQIDTQIHTHKQTNTHFFVRPKHLHSHALICFVRNLLYVTSSSSCLINYVDL